MRLQLLALLSGASLLASTACSVVPDACGTDLTCDPQDGGIDSSKDGTTPGDSSPDVDAGRDDGSSDSSIPLDAIADAHEGGLIDSTPPCDPTQSPAKEACVIDEKYGVFVAATGDDATGDGSRTKPFGTLAKATKSASSAKKRVYSCGTFVTSLSLDATTDGLTLYGGFDCATWKYSSVKTIVAPTAPGVALHVKATTLVTELVDFQFTSQAASTSTPGDSSIGAVIENAAKVRLTSVAIGAGTATGGTSATPPATTLPVATKGNDAPDAPSLTGGGPTNCACPFGTASAGGQGGPGGVAPGDGTSGGPGGVPNKGVTGGACNGSKGVDGSPSGDGAGAKTNGAWASGSWIPASGERGIAGITGQGGGGGAGNAGAGNGGGGGGCGGCGGDGAPPGTGGGSSIGLLVVATNVEIASSTFTASGAGNGGAGAVGQPGAAGAGRGNASSLGTGCQGGPGGAGGSGGSGGGGAGGLSIAIAYSGTAPTFDTATTYTTGAAGLAGAGGKPTVNDGVSGVKQDVYPLP